VLLDDAVRLARQAAAADVEVILDITPGECRTSSNPSQFSTKRRSHWTEPGQLLSTHLAGAAHVTA
jgi:hypothetical protein